VMKDGSVTGGVWAELRRARLLEEGVAFTRDGRVDMKAHGWDPAGSDIDFEEFDFGVEMGIEVDGDAGADVK